MHYRKSLRLSKAKRLEVALAMLEVQTPHKFEVFEAELKVDLQDLLVF